MGEAALMAETLLGAATRLKRRAAELERAEAKAERAIGGTTEKAARDEAAELVHALCDGQHVFEQLLREAQHRYGVRTAP